MNWPRIAVAYQLVSTIANIYAKSPSKSSCLYRSFLQSIAGVLLPGSTYEANEQSTNCWHHKYLTQITKISFQKQSNPIPLRGVVDLHKPKPLFNNQSSTYLPTYNLLVTSIKLFSFFPLFFGCLLLLVRYFGPCHCQCGTNSKLVCWKLHCKRLLGNKTIEQEKDAESVVGRLVNKKQLKKMRKKISNDTTEKKEMWREKTLFYHLKVLL